MLQSCIPSKHTHTSYVSNILLSSLADSWSIRGLDSCGANKSTIQHNPTNMLLLLLSDFREHREPASEMSIAKRLCAWLLCSFSPRNSDLGWSRMEVRGATEQKSLKWRQFMKTWYDIVQHDNTIYVYTYIIIIYIYNILYMISELNRIDMNRRWCWRNFTLFGSKRSSARKRSILTAWNPGFQRAGLCNRRGAPSQQDPTRECYFRVIVPHIKTLKNNLKQ